MSGSQGPDGPRMGVLARYWHERKKEIISISTILSIVGVAITLYTFDPQLGDKIDRLLDGLNRAPETIRKNTDASIEKSMVELREMIAASLQSPQQQAVNPAIAPPSSTAVSPPQPSVSPPSSPPASPETKPTITDNRSIFVAYSADSDIDRSLALALGDRLRAAGLQTTTDRRDAALVVSIASTNFAEPRQTDLSGGWIRWRTTARLELGLKSGETEFSTKLISGTGEAESPETARAKALLDAVQEGARYVEAKIINSQFASPH